MRVIEHALPFYPSPQTGPTLPGYWSMLSVMHLPITPISFPYPIYPKVLMLKSA